MAGGRAGGSLAAAALGGRGAFADAALGALGASDGAAGAAACGRTYGERRTGGEGMENPRKTEDMRKKKS